VHHREEHEAQQCKVQHECTDIVCDLEGGLVVDHRAKEESTVDRAIRGISALRFVHQGAADERCVGHEFVRVARARER
jgi:hypothetical protein